MADRHLVALRGDEADLFRLHHARLLRAVARSVNAPQALIEDACQFAWSALLRSQPQREAAFAWLCVVAVHEAYRLSAKERDHGSLDELTAHVEVEHPVLVGDWDAFVAGPRELDDELEARRALRALAALPEKSRRYLAWKIAGYSYQEIQRLAGGVSYTNVNTHLVKARRRLDQNQSEAA